MMTVRDETDHGSSPRGADGKLSPQQLLQAKQN